MSVLQSLLLVECTGVFDGATLVAVERWQRSNKLEPDGVVGLLTWDAIARTLERFRA